jgi:hypothetical protein
MAILSSYPTWDRLAVPDAVAASPGAGVFERAATVADNGFIAGVVPDAPAFAPVEISPLLVPLPVCTLTLLPAPSLELGRVCRRDPRGHGPSSRSVSEWCAGVCDCHVLPV